MHDLSNVSFITQLVEKVAVAATRVVDRGATFRSEDGGEFAAVNLEGDVLEDYPDTDRADQLLQTCAGLNLRIEWSAVFFLESKKYLMHISWKQRENLYIIHGNKEKIDT